MDSLQDEGIYLLDNGLSIFLYIGRAVSEDMRRAVMDSANYNGSNTSNPRVNRLLWQMRTFVSLCRGSESELRPTFAPLVKVLQEEGTGSNRTPLETSVLNLMVDDANGGEKDYDGFLRALHKRTRDKALTQ